MDAKKNTTVIEAGGYDFSPGHQMQSGASVAPEGVLSAEQFDSIPNSEFIALLTMLTGILKNKRKHRVRVSRKLSGLALISRLIPRDLT